MKTLFTLLALSSAIIIYAQDTHELTAFHTIVAGPHIELKLTEGISEDIRIETKGVSDDKVVYGVKGNRLEVYLVNARNIEKNNKYRRNGSKWSEGIYKDTKVTAYITYRNLKKLVTKGEESINVDGTIGGNSFKYKSYGDQKATFESVETEALRMKLYGSTDIKIKNGFAHLQRYKLYGEHDINTENVKSNKVRASNFGEVEMDVDANIVQLTSFGIADISSKTAAKIRKGIVIGETRIR